MEEDTTISEDNVPEPEQKQDRKMYSAKCSECGNDCEVPFEPSEGKKVRCLDCFKKFKGNRFKKRLYDATCSKCNKRCKVPFRPNGTKPIFCRDCYKSDKE